MKTKVMRLNETESALVDLLRNIGGDLVLSELSNCYNGVPNKEQYFILKRMISILEEKKIFDMDALINSDFITVEDSKYLIKCMEENRNIIITGDSGSGKTTLLNALLCYQDDVQMVIFERMKELTLTDEILSKDITICQESDSISMKDIVILNDKSRLVIGEIIAGEDGLGILGSLKLGSSILTTMPCDSNCRSEFLNLFTDNMKPYAEEVLNKDGFIHVIVEYDRVSGKRRVVKIKEM